MVANRNHPRFGSVAPGSKRSKASFDPARGVPRLKQAINTLTRALGAKDPYTCAHSRRVQRMASRIAQVLCVSRSVRYDILVGAALHDIGKIGVAGGVLRRPGPLQPDEIRQIKLHPTLGEEILRPMLADRPGVLAVVRSHHERMDGRGYPDGLSGTSIPIAARIVAVADAFDAMTSDRPYRRGLTSGQALERLRAGAGSQFDPACVRALVAILRPAPARHTVSAQLASGTPEPVPGSAGCRQPRFARLGTARSAHPP